MAPPGLKEVLSSLRGTVRLFRRDAGGFSDFNLTEEGFWHSFFVIVLVLPMVAFAVYTLVPATVIEPAAIVGRKSSLLILQWAVFATLMLAFTDAMNLQSRYMTLVISYNWCSVLGVAIQMVPVLLCALGVFDKGLAQFILFMVFLSLLPFFWFASREALATNGGIAAGIVAVDQFLQFGLEYTFGLR